MDIKDIVVGETYQYSNSYKDEGKLKVTGKGEKQVLGLMSWEGGYESAFGECMVPAARLSPIPKRYVVEMRNPKRGEKYLEDGTVQTCGYDGQVYCFSPVIIEELQ